MRRSNVLTAVFFLVFGVMVSVTLNGCGGSGGSGSNGGGGGSSSGGDISPTPNPSPDPTPTSPLVVKTISVTPGATSVTAGNTSQLSATACDQYGNPIAASVVWSSSDIAIAKVSNNGLVMAVSAGSATITATQGYISGNVVVTVTPQLWKVNNGGVIGVTYVNGNDVYVAVNRSGDAWLAKFNSAGEKQWEVPVLVTDLVDKIDGIGIFGNVVEMICQKSDGSVETPMFEKISAVDGSKLLEDQVLADAAVRGFTVNPADGSWYATFTTKTGKFIAHADNNGNLLSSAWPTTPEHFEQTIIGNDGIYVVGTIGSNGAFDRVYAVKFNKDLSTRLWTQSWQQRPFTSSNNCDGFGGAVLVGNDLYVAVTDNPDWQQSGIPPVGILSIVDSATGRTTKELTIGQKLGLLTLGQPGFLFASLDYYASPVRIRIVDGSIIQASVTDNVRYSGMIAVVSDIVLVPGVDNADQFIIFDATTLARK